MPHKRREYQVGDKVYLIDRINVFGREFLVIEPAIIERDYRGDQDFDGSYEVRLEYNGEYCGAHLGQLLPREV